MVECAGGDEDLEAASRRKSPLFGWFLGLDAGNARTEGSLH